MTISLNANSRTASKDEILFKEGDAANRIFLIKSGSVICLKKSKERLIPVFNAGAEQILGEEAVLSRIAYTYSAVVTEAGEIVELDGNLLMDTLEQAPYWVGSLMATLGERLADTSEAIAEHRIASLDLSGDEFTAKEETRLKKLLV